MFEEDPYRGKFDDPEKIDKQTGFFFNISTAQCLAAFIQIFP